MNKFKPRKSANVASQSGKRSLSAAAPADVPRPGRPTISDVAALAGVSIKTVSRVFNNEPNVAPATRSLVQTAQMLVSSRPRENLVAIAIAVTPSSALCASRSAACWSAAGLVSHEQ